MTNQNNEKSKNGKRIALILLALLLIAAIAFGAYTYSKYISSANGTGSASVAKWGFTITASNVNDTDDTNVFGQYYGTSGTEQDGKDNAVIAGASSEVVAPGAKGSFKFTVEGTAEVRAKISATVTTNKDVSLTLTKSGSDSVVYNPIKFTLNDGSTDVVTDGTMAKVKTYLESDEFSKTVEAGKTVTGVAGTTSKTYTLSWEWGFDGQTLTVDNDNGYTVNCDKLDTILGQIASNSTSPASYSVTDSNEDVWTVTAGEAVTAFNFSIKIEITQVMS